MEYRGYTIIKGYRCCRKRWHVYVELPCRPWTRYIDSFDTKQEAVDYVDQAVDGGIARLEADLAQTG